VGNIAYMLLVRLFENDVMKRLHRIITSSELVAAYDSAKELFELLRNRDFAKMFQKNTIR
ncbi:hypothetical protein CHS0354_019320, partial [Potamilus streckersoni]